MSFEVKAAVLVLEQEGLLRSAADQLDQKAAPLAVGGDGFAGDVGQRDARCPAAGSLRQLGDELLGEGMKENGAAALPRADHAVQALAPPHAVLALARRPDANVGDDRIHLLAGALFALVVGTLGLAASHELCPAQLLVGMVAYRFPFRLGSLEIGFEFLLALGDAAYDRGV